MVRACAAERIRTAVGTCPSPEQALAAARAGAAHVSAPVGRAGGVDGNDVIRKLVALFRTYGVPTEIVAAAIRIPTDVIDAALAGRARRRGAGRRVAGARRRELAPGRWARLTAPAMRIRQHVNPLKSDLLDIADVPRVEVEPGRALEVELGAAEAHFLIDRARDDRTTAFVGVEIRRELVDAVNAARARRAARPTCAACSPTCRSTWRACSATAACGASS